MVVRAWLDDRAGGTFLYYSVEHSPDSIHKKLEHDFDWFRARTRIAALPREVPNKLVLHTPDEATGSQLILTPGAAGGAAAEECARHHRRHRVDPRRDREPRPSPPRCAWW
jgi:hypothetical protein